MERVLAHIPRNQSVVDLNYLLVHAADFELALETLRQVFQAIRSAGLCLETRFLSWEQRAWLPILPS